MVFLLGVIADWARGQPALQVPHIFGDHMVLQAGQPVPVWGWAHPGDAITVTFAGQHKQTVAAHEDGAWKITLDPLPVSSGPSVLTIAGPETIAFHDVLVGEVWLCSGQSNMQKPVGTWRGQPITTIDYQQELAAADYPLIRMLNQEISNADAPAKDFNVTPRGNTDYPWEGWVACSPASLDRIKFSAAGYFFGRKLFQELKVPIGLIEASAGGTQVEAWTPASGFTTDPALADFVVAARTPKVRYDGTSISTLYNGMIHPMEPFALSGVLWYQGESNLLKGDGAIYAHKVTAMIRSWRARWGRDLPFYFVQLPPLSYSVRKNPTHAREDEPVFREAQAAALKLPHTGMVVTTDVGDLKNMHPPHKKEVGERLALWALAEDYERKDLEPSGPMYQAGSLELDGARAVLHFRHIGRGLVSRDGRPLSWFTVAGAEGKFYPAMATIAGDTVVVTSPQVAEARAVRFAWDEAANPNFFNRDGLPAAPFRTDKPAEAVAAMPLVGGRNNPRDSGGR
jgi:sialate O-acetylesterase